MSDPLPLDNTIIRPHFTQVLGHTQGLGTPFRLDPRYRPTSVYSTTTTTREITCLGRPPYIGVIPANETVKYCIPGVAIWKNKIPETLPRMKKYEICLSCGLKSGSGAHDVGRCGSLRIEISLFPPFLIFIAIDIICSVAKITRSRHFLHCTATWRI